MNGGRFLNDPPNSGKRQARQNHADSSISLSVKRSANHPPHGIRKSRTTAMCCMCCMCFTSLSPTCAGGRFSKAVNTRVSNTRPCGKVLPANSTGIASRSSASTASSPHRCSACCSRLRSPSSHFTRLPKSTHMLPVIIVQCLPSIPTPSTVGPEAIMVKRWPSEANHAW